MFANPQAVALKKELLKYQTMLLEKDKKKPPKKKPGKAKRVERP